LLFAVSRGADIGAFCAEIDALGAAATAKVLACCVAENTGTAATAAQKSPQRLKILRNFPLNFTNLDFTLFS